MQQLQGSCWLLYLWPFIISKILEYAKTRVANGLDMGGYSVRYRIRDALREAHLIALDKQQQETSGAQYGDQIQKLERVSDFIDWKLKKLRKAEARLRY